MDRFVNRSYRASNRFSTSSRPVSRSVEQRIAIPRRFDDNRMVPRELSFTRRARIPGARRNQQDWIDKTESTMGKHRKKVTVRLPLVCTGSPWNNSKSEKSFLSTNLFVRAHDSYTRLPSAAPRRAYLRTQPTFSSLAFEHEDQLKFNDDKFIRRPIRSLHAVKTRRIEVAGIYRNNQSSRVSPCTREVTDINISSSIFRFTCRVCCIRAAYARYATRDKRENI